MRRGNPRRLPLACCALSALIAGVACDLSPRTPDDPGGGSNDRLVNLSDPDSVLLQIQVGLTDGRINSYMNAFTQDFVFHPDERDSLTLIQQSPGVFDDWVYQIESDVMQVVFSQYSQRNVSFVNAESTSVAPDIVVIDEEYDLTVDSERYQGRAEFQMRLTGNEWRIFMWIDRRLSGSELSSWSLLKGENR